ncbi:hypothetical protein LTR60_003275 [Cryomyces antarcticus]|nr:hypothetical protein LTR60_003275 [Cryomyces antarcticus]KAK5015264.1 hypothetical protein LTR39_002709 [Cryomyces antarcticus]
MLQGFQQLCGFNSLMYFSATIFSLLDFTNPTLPSLSIALTNFAFTLVAFHAIDRIGRRRILLLSIPVMVVGLALCSLAFGFLDLPTHEAVGTPVSSASSVSTALLRFRLVARNAAATSWPLLILLSLILYVASYALGLGNVPWQQSELFALPVRALGSAAATATNWGANCLVGLTFLPLMHALSPAGTFALYAGVCVVGWVGVWRIYPETVGLGLEEVGGLLRNGWGVDESVRGFEARRRAGRQGRSWDAGL